MCIWGFTRRDVTSVYIVNVYTCRNSAIALQNTVAKTCHKITSRKEVVFFRFLTQVKDIRETYFPGRNFGEKHINQILSRYRHIENGRA